MVTSINAHGSLTWSLPSSVVYILLWMGDIVVGWYLGTFATCIDIEKVNYRGNKLMESVRADR